MSYTNSGGGRQITVTGMGLVSALGSTIEAFTQALQMGRSGISALAEDSFLGMSAAALVEDFDLLRAMAVLEQLPEDYLQRAETACRRAPMVVQTAVYSVLYAWWQAQLCRSHIEPVRVGLVVGGQNLNCHYSYDHFKRFYADLDFLPPSYGLNFLDTNLVGVVSEVLQLQGPGFTVGGASASGNVGIIQGYHMIQSGQVDLCVVIGAMADLSPLEAQAFRAMGAMGGKSLGAESSCRPFDEAHEGFIYGQGCGCLILEGVEHARQRGVEPLTNIAGVALTLDGNRMANPDAVGEARAMRQAINTAGLSVDDVQYINTHGSSSPLGDKTELDAIRSLFGERANSVWLNATKGLTGHCLFAAGVLEAIATLVQMRGGFLHPNKNLDNPIDRELRFVSSHMEEVKVSCALSNSFGFGGINSSILLTSSTS